MVFLQNRVMKRDYKQIVLSQWFSNWVPRNIDENLGTIMFCNYIYGISIIILQYKYKVIFKNKWITF